MAVPTAQEQRTGSEQRPPVSKFVTWIRNLGASIGRPLFALVLAIVAGGIVIMITSPGSLGDRFTSAISAYQALYMGSFGDLESFSFTLVTVTPLLFAGLSVAIAFRAGLFNIGAEGQLAMGAITASIIGARASSWPGWLLVPTLIIAGALAGAIWGGIVGILKAWRGAHEVVTTIMLNWIAFFVTDYLIGGPFKDPFLANSTSPIVPQGRLPGIAVLYNQTLGNFLPQIADASSYLVDVSFFFSLLALVVYWFITSRTTFGYEIRVIGQNLKAARYAGIPIKRNLFAVMAIAGAFAGLAGALHLIGQAPYELNGSSFRIETTGFDAIGVALLGRTTAVGVLLASLLFGGLRQGAGLMQLQAGVPGDLVFIIQALVLFSIASEFLPAIQRNLPNWMALGRRPALVPAITGMTVATLPENGNGIEQNGAEQSEPAQEDRGGDGSTQRTLTAENGPDQMTES